jgi:peptidoglycan hydrolase-like protein with peptidoglycan-binding domain
MARKILLFIGVILLGVLVSASFLAAVPAQASEHTSGSIPTGSRWAMAAQVSGATPGTTGAVPCSNFNDPTTMISSGNTGDCVMVWQWILKIASMYCAPDLGAQNLAINSNFDKPTQAATVFLQRDGNQQDNTVTIDGIVGPQTRGVAEKLFAQCLKDQQSGSGQGGSMQPAPAAAPMPSSTVTGQCQNFDSTTINIGMGDAGADPCVAMWQQDLKKAANCLLNLDGQDLAVDGDFGLQTQATTVYFQQDEQLKSIDGIVGSDTHTAMNNVLKNCKQ